MLLLGIILGFIGAGGSGFIIAILVTLFNIPIHFALGTAVMVMFFSVLVGSLTHYRGKNLAFKQGIVIGLFGGIGAYGGSQLTKLIDSELLLVFTMCSLFFSGVVLWIRTNIKTAEGNSKLSESGWNIKCAVIGIGNGIISGSFGIGGAPFIQISLIKWLSYPIRLAAGTTMLIILPISLSASLGFIQNGFVDFHLFFKVISGVIIGTYLGARLTSILPSAILRYGMVLTPFASGGLILFGLITNS